MFCSLLQPCNFFWYDNYFVGIFVVQTLNDTDDSKWKGVQKAYKYKNLFAYIKILLSLLKIDSKIAPKYVNKYVNCIHIHFSFFIQKIK